MVAIQSVKTGGRHVFEIGIFGSKIILIFLLIILSFINADVSFIQKKPRNFLGEAIVLGASAAIPFIFIAKNRGQDLGDAFSVSVTAFLIFFLFHIVMEFSGQNRSAAGVQLSAGEQKQNNLLQKIMKLSVFKVVVGGIAAIMLLLAFMVHDFGPGLKVILLEALFMAVCGALPTVMVALDRDEKDTMKIIKDFFTFFAMFFLGHVILQLGGFYTHLFMKKPDEVLPPTST